MYLNESSPENCTKRNFFSLHSISINTALFVSGFLSRGANAYSQNSREREPHIHAKGEAIANAMYGPESIPNQTPPPSRARSNPLRVMWEDDPPHFQG